MNLRLEGVRTRGRALDLRRSDVAVPALLDAIRDPADDRVRCRTPGPAHQHVCHLTPTTDAPSVRALAAVARSRGLRPMDVDDPPADPVSARRAVADAEADVAALRDRVERAGGRLEARRALGADTTDAERGLREATQALTDAETERVAAEQRLAAAEARLRGARDDREARLRRTDACRNHRAVRAAALAARVRPLVERARAAVPDWNPEALAAVRVARTRAPIVVERGPFRRPAGAAACLDAPVVLV